MCNGEMRSRGTHTHTQRTKTRWHNLYPYKEAQSRPNPSVRDSRAVTTTNPQRLCCRSNWKGKDGLIVARKGVVVCLQVLVMVMVRKLYINIYICTRDCLCFRRVGGSLVRW